jgi:tetratricopeptide (TPR) repeat protein
MFEGAVAEAERSGAANDELSRLRDEGRLLRRQLERDTLDFQRATTLQELGRLDEAVVVLDALVRRRPEEISPRLQLGVSLEALGRIADAAALYQDAIGQGTASPEMIYRLGCIAQDEGAVSEARACFDLLVRKGFTPAGLRERLTRMRADATLPS